MHRLFQPSKNSRDCTQTVRPGSFSMDGARFGAYCNQKFRDRPGCVGGTGQKKRMGLYMVVRPTLFLWVGPNKRLPRDVGINIL